VLPVLQQAVEVGCATLVVRQNCADEGAQLRHLVLQVVDGQGWARGACPAGAVEVEGVAHLVAEVGERMVGAAVGTRS